MGNFRTAGVSSGLKKKETCFCRNIQMWMFSQMCVFLLLYGKSGCLWGCDPIKRAKFRLISASDVGV